MISSLNRRIAMFVAVAFSGCVVLSVLGAAQSRQMTLEEVVRRLLALEDRVAKLERKVGIKGEAEKPRAEAPIIEITNPRDRADVGQRVLVEGIARVDDLKGRVPVVLVHPVETNTWWAQPPVTVDKGLGGFKFRVSVYCGERARGKGEWFEIAAFLAPKGRYDKGAQLDKLPSDVSVSPVVVVQRTKD